MPVKLSSYLLLRNSYLMPMVNNPNNETGRYMVPEQKVILKRMIDEIDELHKGSSVRRNTEGVDHPNVALAPGFPEIVELSSDPKRSGYLFHKIHGILKNHFVDVNIYRNLGGAFAELGIEEINPELKIAIEHGTRNARARSRGIYVNTNDRMCARVVIDQEVRKRNASKERH